MRPTSLSARLYDIKLANNRTSKYGNGEHSYTNIVTVYECNYVICLCIYSLYAQNSVFIERDSWKDESEEHLPVTMFEKRNASF